jgi:predicted RNA-binding Zn-ribbon protein involved in translation (DUF1610 family)
MSARQFDSLRASALYCPRCGKAMPVREKLLLILPDKELYDYLCAGCGDSIGTREVTATEKLMNETLAARRGRGAQVRML